MGRLPVQGPIVPAGGTIASSIVMDKVSSLHAGIPIFQNARGDMADALAGFGVSMFSDCAS